MAFAPPLDGQAAVETARGFLGRMGVIKIVGLAALSQGRAKDWHWRGGRIWVVGFDLPKGAGFAVNLDDRGEVFYASRTGRQNHAPLDRALARRFGARLMARVPHAIPVRQDADDPRSFRAVVDGRDYFNLNPTYGYRIDFDESGGLTWFGRQDVLPPPSARVPKVGRTAALARLASARRAKGVPAPRVEPELGYYVRKGESRARLVWRSATDMPNILVDAVSGAIFEADDR